MPATERDGAGMERMMPGQAGHGGCWHWQVPHGSVPEPSRRCGSAAQRLLGEMLSTVYVLESLNQPSLRSTEAELREKCQGHALCQHSPAPQAAIPLHRHSRESCKAQKPHK